MNVHLFICATSQVICHSSVPSEFEQPTSKKSGPSNGPKTQNRSFLKKKMAND